MKCLLRGEMFDHRSLDEALFHHDHKQRPRHSVFGFRAGAVIAVSAAALGYRDVVSRYDDRSDDPPGCVEAANHSAELSSWSGERTDGMASNNPKRSNLGNDWNLSKSRVVFDC